MKDKGEEDTHRIINNYSHQKLYKNNTETETPNKNPHSKGGNNININEGQLKYGQDDAQKTIFSFQNASFSNQTNKNSNNNPCINNQVFNQKNHHKNNDIIIEDKEKEFFLDNGPTRNKIRLTAYQRFKENNSATKLKSTSRNKSNKSNDVLLLNLLLTQRTQKDKYYDNNYAPINVTHRSRNYSMNSMNSSSSWNQKMTSSIKNPLHSQEKFRESGRKETVSSARQHEHSKTRRSFNKLADLYTSNSQCKTVTSRNPKYEKYQQKTVDDKIPQQDNHNKPKDKLQFSCEPLNKKPFRYFTMTEIAIQEHNDKLFEREHAKKPQTTKAYIYTQSLTQYKPNHNQLKHLALQPQIRTSTKKNNTVGTTVNKQPNRQKHNKGRTVKLCNHNTSSYISYFQRKFPNSLRYTHENKPENKEYQYSKNFTYKNTYEPKPQYKNTITRKDLGLESFFDFRCNSNDSSTNRTSNNEKHVNKTNKSISKETYYLNKILKEQMKNFENEKTQIFFDETEHSNDLYKYKKDQLSNLCTSSCEGITDIRQIVSKFGLLNPSKQSILSSDKKKE